VPDKTGDEIFSVLSDVHENFGVSAEHKNFKSAYDDPSLAGGGVTKLQALLHKKLAYCTNKNESHGKLECQRLLPDGHVGPCCSCGHATDREVNGVRANISEDHVIDLGHYYEIIFQSTGIAQRICDYHKTSMERLSTCPKDEKARVHCVESALIARQDRARNPDWFELDVEARPGEKAILNRPGELRESVQVVQKLRSGYIVKMLTGSCKGTRQLIVDPSTVEKEGGHFPVNVVAFDDAGEVFQSSTIMYSPCARTEEMQNIAVAHRRRCEFNAMLGFEGGGEHHKNVRARNVYYERQRRRLQQEGHTLHGVTLKVTYNGRECVMHSPTVRRNEYFRVLDHPEMVRQGSGMGARSPDSLKPILKDSTAVSLRNKACYSFLAAPNCTPQDEQESCKLYNEAEAKRGKEGWDKAAPKLGCKGTLLAISGDPLYGLPPDPTQNQYSRLDYGRMHQDGIRDNLFRKLILSLVPVGRRKVLSQQHDALRQPRGTKPTKQYVKTATGEFSGATEKLHDKKHWRLHRMRYDLKPLFEPGEEKTKRVHEVCQVILWHIK
jgi:hypothetical protein